MFVREDKDDDKTVEKPDTSKNDDDSTEDEEDSTDESDSNDTEGKGNKKEDEEDTDEEDLSKKYFTDPASVPKQFRVAFKKMQGSYTKKMQDLSRGIEKANAFDQLILDPDFRKFMEMKRKGQKFSASDSNDDSEDDEDDDRPPTRKELRAMLQAETKKAFEPFARKEQDMELKMQAAEFKKSNPDWQMYRDEIYEVMGKHPTLSFQEAYDLASKDERGMSDTEETVKKKKLGNTSKPNKTGAKDVQEKKGKMTINEAFQLAKRKLKLIS